MFAQTRDTSSPRVLASHLLPTSLHGLVHALDSLGRAVDLQTHVTHPPLHGRANHAVPKEAANFDEDVRFLCIAIGSQVLRVRK